MPGVLNSSFPAHQMTCKLSLRRLLVPYMPLANFLSQSQRDVSRNRGHSTAKKLLGASVLSRSCTETCQLLPKSIHRAKLSPAQPAAMAEMAARDRKHQELGDALVERRRHEVTIVGAGLVGSLLAVVLRSRGYRVTVYEGRRDPREGTQENSAGRSINLVATARGLKALSTLPPDVATRL